VPVFVVAYFTDERDIKYYALLVYVFAGLSDLLDGFIARKYNAQSKMGKVLDPLGDKLMTFTVIVCITITRPILLWAALVFFIKEVLMGIGGLVIHKKAQIEIPPSNLVGKASTVLFFFVCVTLLFFNNLSNVITSILISAAIGLTLIALAVYLKSYIKIMRSVSKTADENNFIEENNKND